MTTDEGRYILEDIASDNQKPEEKVDSEDEDSIELTEEELNG